jgi:hypothetical protein
VSPLSNVQFSRFCEVEVAKLFTFGSDGLLEVTVPMTDDERRDLELHIKERFRLSAAIQVKARQVLMHRGSSSVGWLHIRFDEKPERLIANPFFWYFFGYMDLETMRYQAPVFLVPSTAVHTNADPRRHGDIIRFTFAASLDPNSDDKWRAYACKPAEVAARMLEFLRAQSRRKLTAEDISVATAIRQLGTILVARAPR